MSIEHSAASASGGIDVPPDRLRHPSNRAPTFVPPLPPPFVTGDWRRMPTA